MICLARVLLQKKKIIILNEPTAYVDPEDPVDLEDCVRETEGLDGHDDRSPPEHY